MTNVFPDDKTYWGEAKCTLIDGTLTINAEEKDVVADNFNETPWYNYSTNDLKKITKVIILGHVGFNERTNLYALFRYFSNCLDINGLKNFDTSKVTDMNSMFFGCSGLNSLDVSKFDTSKVTDMNSMFSGCSGLNSLDVSKFDTSKVTDMNSMFFGCSGLNSLDVSKFDTSNVKYMNTMFFGCSGLNSLDVSKFDTSKVTDMNTMFSGCNNLKFIKLNNAITINNYIELK